MLKIALAVSVLLNMGLAAVSIQQYRAPQSGAGAKVPAAESSLTTTVVSLPPATSSSVPTEMPAVYLHAITAGVEEELAKYVLASALKVELGAISADRYWEPPAKRGYERQSAELRAYDGARQLVLNEVGARAVEDPVFAFLFKPYQDQLPFLSSEKQLRLQHLKVDVQRKALTASGAARPPGVGQAAAATLQEELKQIFSSEELFEYQVRDSLAAQMLAATEFQFTEPEFREIFKILGAGHATGLFFGSMAALSGQPASSDPKLAAVKDVLGDARFKEYQRAQDPTFKLTLSIASANGLPRETALKAYDILETAAQQRAQSNLHGPILTGPQRQQLEQITAARDSMLKDVLGNGAFGDLSRMLSSMDAGGQFAPRSIPFTGRAKPIQVGR